MTAIASPPASLGQIDPWHTVMRRISSVLHTKGLHPSKAVVLVPYAQLITQAQGAWAAQKGDAKFCTSFLPRFETTLNWAESLRAASARAAGDICQDAALDTLTAAHLLASAGLGTHSNALALQALLVESACSLARVAAAQNPTHRLAWGAAASRELGQGLESPYLALELAVGRIALAWACSSSYATDALHNTPVEMLFIVKGLQADPLTEALQQRAVAATETLAFTAPALQQGGGPHLHPAMDAEDEAQRAAACVLAHLAAGRKPVALVAQDRLLTRRVGAVLATRGITLRDETGWTLSTTRAAATFMGFLRALPAEAPADAVLDWLKNAPAFAPADVRSAETLLRKNGTRFWRDGMGLDAALPGLSPAVQRLQNAMEGRRPLSEWLHAVRAGLQGCGQWEPLAADTAGKAVLAALHIEPGKALFFTNNIAANRNPTMSLRDFTHWAGHALESGSFSPVHAVDAQVVILPMSQLLGRSFAAAVLPGCDENRLPVSPELPGQWTPRQRAVLGLPSRSDLAATQRAAWHVALAHQHLDVLWRQSENGEHLMPSGFVQELMLDRQRDTHAGEKGNEKGNEKGDGKQVGKGIKNGLESGQNQNQTNGAATASDPRVSRTVQARPTPRPMPLGAALLGTMPALSATAYEDLRRCPYRFFALRLLRVQQADELESELGKREFGNWLHATLHLFHEALKSAPAQDIQARAAMLDIASEQAGKDLALSASEFLPFAAIWPSTRDNYLTWLTRHEASGAQYAEGEVWKSMPLGNFALSGKLDRIDVMPDQSRVVMDYKTEALDKTRQRIKSGQEDTQLAFYAALLPDDTLAASYVNLGEKARTEALEQKEVVDLRDDLIAGILSDLTRIENGAALPALGEGDACTFCAARGLCRKDFWNK